jgi:hypothetical protein
MNFSLPPWSSILSTLGGAAGITGVICTIVGATPGSTVGKAVEGIVSGVLVIVAHWHASSVVATKAKVKAGATPPPVAPTATA